MKVTKVKKSVGVRPWLERRKEKGCYHNLFQELSVEDTASFQEFIRKDKMHFNYLVKKLYPRLQKTDTVMRESIKPPEQCCLFLRYIASGESFRSLEYQFRLSRRSISRIVSNVAQALIGVFQKQYLRTPSNAEEWMVISEKFFQRWNFPNLIGAVDGKHIVLEQPNNSGSHYRNYKGTDSLILMAVVGPEYQFLFADVGMNARNSDGGNWSSSPMKKALENNTLNLPKPRPLPNLNATHNIPFVFVEDEAFPLTPYMMKPYSQKCLSPDKRIFNYRLSRARRISENGFGILASRWRIFRRLFALEPEKVKIITFPVISVHNWLRSDATSGKIYVPPHFIDYEDIDGNVTPGEWRKDIPDESWQNLKPSTNKNPSQYAKEIRDEFKDFFMTEGSVPW